MVEQVYHEALDVGPVQILVRHYHEGPVAERFYVVVLFSDLEAWGGVIKGGVPKILMRFWISWFSMICLVVASLTLSSFPFRGKTPNLSRPTVSMPGVNFGKITGHGERLGTVSFGDN